MESPPHQVLQSSSQGVSQPTETQNSIRELPVFSPEYSPTQQGFHQLQSVFNITVLKIHSHQMGSPPTNARRELPDQNSTKKDDMIHSCTLPHISTKHHQDSPEPESCQGLPIASMKKAGFKEREQKDTQAPTEDIMFENQEMEIDNESDGNQLPISSMVRYLNNTHFEEPSESSEDQHSRSRNLIDCIPFCAVRNKSRGHRREGKEGLMTCSHCKAWMEKTQAQQTYNRQLVKQIEHYREELRRIQQKKKNCSSHSETLSNEEGILETISFDINETSSLSEQLITLVSEATKILQKFTTSNTTLDSSFNQYEKKILMSFNEQFSNFENPDHERNLRKQNQKQIHTQYKKLIENMQREYKERETKAHDDFKAFMEMVNSKSQMNKQISFSQLVESIPDLVRIRTKKVKTARSISESVDNEIIEQMQQRIELLELKYQKEKNKVKTLQKYQNQIIQKQLQLIADLNKQKTLYKTTLNKSAEDFTTFMKTLAQKNRTVFQEIQFFNTVCQRVYEISNCIPFEDNDEQNLFTPETKSEVYDMLEHIRRFSLNLENHNRRKDRDYQNLKKHFTLLLKQLIQSEKVSKKHLLKLINRHNELGLDYIKDYLHSLKAKSKLDPRHASKQRTGKTGLKMEKTESFTFKYQKNQSTSKYDKRKSAFKYEKSDSI